MSYSGRRMPHSTEIGQLLTKFGPSLNLARSGQNCLANVGRFGPNLLSIRPNWAELGARGFQRSLQQCLRDVEHCLGRALFEHLFATLFALRGGIFSACFLSIFSKCRDWAPDATFDQHRPEFDHIQPESGFCRLWRTLARLDLAKFGRILRRRPEITPKMLPRAFVDHFSSICPGSAARPVRRRPIWRALFAVLRGGILSAFVVAFCEGSRLRGLVGLAATQS